MRDSSELEELSSGGRICNTAITSMSTIGAPNAAAAAAAAAAVCQHQTLKAGQSNTE
ncbi:hypothetical protein LOAG_09045 [Loa loa]|uniref:Uncharacterized protein n=1 Tax=Loa loa TaxID=7209 RepID=A0A1S0TSN4_LOALO|nr:hypothetical protein LOAG_09045 [Loa loa]EFO19445.1 hypothetical protein LOAG_09045 [Loa loa]